MSTRLAPRYEEIEIYPGVTEQVASDEIEFDAQKHTPGGHPHDQSSHGRRQGGETDSEAFRRWFGKSKVVRNGAPAETARSEVNQGAEGDEPLVVFHGTNAEFRVFNNPHGGWNMFSESREYAQQFAIDFGPGDRGQVMELYLRIENPLDLTHLPARRGDARRKLLQTLEDVVPEEFLTLLEKDLAYERDIYQIVNSRKSRELLMQALRAGQFDGILMPDHKVYIEEGSIREVEARTWIAFDPEQIKSATDNAGTFDPDDPDIFKHTPGGKPHDQSTHGRPQGGKRGQQRKPSAKAKAEIARVSAKLNTRAIHRYAENHNERELAKALGGRQPGDNNPHDVELELEGKVHGIELKTMVDNGNRKLTMRKAAMEKKRAWDRKRKQVFHTLVFDDSEMIPGDSFSAKEQALQRFLAGDRKGFRPSKRRIFYRRGYGSFRVDAMHEITGGMEELRELLTMQRRRLPRGAG